MRDTRVLQVDRDELVAFIVEKSQNLSCDKDFVLAMDRLIQFAQHMRQRERLAQVASPAACAPCVVAFSACACCVVVL